MKCRGVPLCDEGIIFPAGVPAESIVFRPCEDEQLLSAFSDHVEKLSDEIEYTVEYLDFDEPVLSLANAYFEDGKLVIEVIETMYSVYRAELQNFRRKKEGAIPFLPWVAPNNLGVVISVLTDDGYVIWAFRDFNRFVRGGQVDASIVESLLPPEKANSAFPPRYLRNEIVRCFEDELCPYPPQSVPEIEIDGLFFDEDYAQWEIVGRMYCPLSKDQILDKHDLRTDHDEKNRLVFMPANDRVRPDQWSSCGEHIMKEFSVISAFENTKTWKTSLKVKSLAARFDPERKWAKKLVCLDVDALVREDDDGNFVASPGMKSLVANLKERKIEVVMATYRNLDFAKRISKIFDMDTVLFSTGSGIYMDGSVINAFPLSKASVAEAVSFCEDVGLDWAASVLPGKVRITPQSSFAEKHSKTSFETVVDEAFEIGEATDVYALYVSCEDAVYDELPRIESCRWRRQKDGTMLLDCDMSCQALSQICLIKNIPSGSVTVIGKYENSSLLDGPWLSIEIGKHSISSRNSGYIADASTYKGIKEACSFFGFVAN